MKTPVVMPSVLAALLCLPLPPFHLPVAQAGPVETVKRVRATGVIRHVDRVQHRLTITHEPVRELGWPAATTSLEVRHDLPLTTVRPGQQVIFSLDDGGRINTLEPVLEADAIPFFPDP